jgi:hypothetical protein
MGYIEDRNLKIALLNFAKHQLLDDWPFICDALVQSYCMQSNLKAQYGFLVLQEASNALRSYIMQAIAPYRTYDQWVLNKHPDIARSSDSWTRSGQNSRLAWIDWMIACYEEDIANAKGQE